MKMNSIARLFLLSAGLFSGTAMAADQTNAELMARVGTLEARVARMEAMFGPALQTPEQQAEQMRQYQETYEKQERAALAQMRAEAEKAKKANKWLNPGPWEKLRIGMPRQEVEQILGKPVSTTMLDTDGLDAWYRAGGTTLTALVSYRHGRLHSFVAPSFPNF